METVGSSIEAVIVIDGTGPVSDKKYERDFKNSFCKRISEMSSNAAYFRGVPGEEGEYAKTLMVMIDNQVRELADRASLRIAYSAQLHAQRHTKLWGQLARELPIYLVGYSRGGLSCVELAEVLQKNDINVEAMYLFDAVNMTYPPGRGEVIPKNVKRCYHAMRNPAFFTEYMRKYWKLKSDNSGLNRKTGLYTYMGDKEELDKAAERLDLTRSNILSLKYNWGNCAVKHEGEAWRLETENKFRGSHGALGGMPWPPEVFPEDKKCSADVEAWMWERLSLRPAGGDNQRIEAAQRILQTA